jgi:hypothetical protein
MRVGRALLYRQRASGMALLWALLLTGALLVITVAFLGLSSTSRQRATRQLEEVTAEELADSARAEILAKLADAFAVETNAPRSGSVAVSPGLAEILSYDVPLNRGNHLGAAAFTGTPGSPTFFSQPFSDTYNGAPANPRWIPLFSWTRFAPRLKNLAILNATVSSPNPEYNPALAFDINTTRNPFTPGVHLISGVAAGTEVLVREKSGEDFASSGAESSFTLDGERSASTRPIWVQWVPVRKHPLKPEGPENPIIGRYAYWVDVENSKLRADLPQTALRTRPEYARLMGEPDAAEGHGSWMAQSEVNSALVARREAEKVLPPRDHEEQLGSNDEPLTRGRTAGYGFAPAAAELAREAWLGWGNGTPLAAGTNAIDWDYFEAPWPRGAAASTMVEKLATTAREWKRTSQRPLHPHLADPEEDDAAAQLLAQVGKGALTFYGHEEDLDPLGREKLDLVEFQNQATASRSTSVSLSSIESHPIWSRLNDAAYHWTYVPGGWASSGAQRSYVGGLAHFFSRSGGANSTEEMARGFALQMLVNIAEYSQPATVAPVVDPARGIVGARSMPYVCEVLTRARSALYELPEADRKDASVLLAGGGSGSFSYTYNGRPLQHYATHVLVDVGLALVNPNPFETESFEGEIELNYEWVGISTTAGARPVRGPQTAPLKGRYTITPQPGKDAKKARVEGDTVYFRLGKVAAADLNRTSALRIHGWTIRRGGQIWHQVPQRHPGGRANPLRFWEMGKIGLNAGAREDPRSFAALQDQGGRAVGWFGRDTLEAMIPDTLFIADWKEGDAVSADLVQRVNRWANGLAQRASIAERVVSIDPTLGHRTLDIGLAGMRGSGHFYGVLGHTWRRGQIFGGVPVVVGNRTEPAAKAVGGWQTETTGISQSTATATVLVPSGGRLAPSSAAVPVAHVSTQLGRYQRGEYLTHKYREPLGYQQPVGVSDEGFLTQMYLSPALDGPQPLGAWDIETFSKDLFKEIPSEKDRPLKHVDIETNQEVPNPEGDWTKSSDGKKGLRSVLSSAPAGRSCITVGEIGFCHSGIAQTPIIVTPDEGRTDYQINSPRNGPPMRMLLDLFKPRPVHDDSGNNVSFESWQAGTTTNAKRYAWNVNTRIAHDDYMILREGGEPLQPGKTSVSPSPLKGRAVWLPTAQGFSRRSDGSEAFRGREAKQIVEKGAGYLLDRHLRPHPLLPRPWDMWTSFVGGDISPARSGEAGTWGVGNVATVFFGPAFMTWEPGLGVQVGETPYVDLQSDPPAYGKLLALGVDGRSEGTEFNDDGDFRPLQEGFLKGRFASDQNMGIFDPSHGFYTPASWTPRFGMLPMRHRISDLAVDYHAENHESTWLNFKTALNPGLSADPLPLPGGNEAELERAERIDGASFPGGFHRSGVYYTAPMAFITSQAGVSANAFTAYIVVQSIRDAKRPLESDAPSGPGIMDAADEVLSERWMRVLIFKDTDYSPPRFRIAATEVANR